MARNPDSDPRPEDAARRTRVGRVRKAAVDARENAMAARETAMSTRELSLTEREELAHLRDETLRARERAAVAAAAQARLLEQMREANEKLVLATLRAEEMAAQADAARVEIAESEERFRSLVTTSAAVVWYANAEGRIHVDPDSWRGFTGLDVDTQEEEPGWLHAVHPDDRASVRESWAAATADGIIYSHQHRLRRPNGIYAWVVSRAVPIPRTGPVREWIGMMTDISDRILIEEARDRFIAILGHDLRNPLSAIMTSAELLAEAGLDGIFARAVDRIARSTQRMGAMIGDLLDFARGRLGGGIPIEREPCDLGRIAGDEVDEMRQAYPGRDIRCEATGDLAGAWDADRIEQLLSNLIGNSIQHGIDPISVSARDAGEVVVVAIHNGGPPIPPATLPRLFEPFQQGAPGASEGLGLGLYIAGEIVRAHGGTIGVTSSEAEGTTVTVSLPRREL
jgi:sigma-B regulation protein RsbU (phosphoserine phosphatase)